MTAALALLLAVGGAYLAAHVVFEWVARRFLIVSAAEYLILGILLGPQVSGVLGAPLLDSLAPIVTLALGWIGVLVGSQFELRQLLLIPARRFRIGFFEAAVTFVVVAGLEFLVMRWTFAPSDGPAIVAAVALGAMAVASSNVGVAVVSRLLGAEGGVVQQLELTSAIDSFFGIAVFGLLLCFQHPALPIARPLTTTEWAVVTIALGVVGGALFHIFLGETPDPDRLFVALVGGVVLVSGSAAYLRMSPLLAGFCFGITLVNTTPRPERFVIAMQRVERPLYYVLLLLGGAAWAPSKLMWVPPVLVFVVARIAAKIGGSRLAARANGALDELGPHWGRALLGQGRLALAIGLNYLHDERILYRNVAFTGAIVSIIVTEFFSARLARSAIVNAGQMPPDVSLFGGDTPTPHPHGMIAIPSDPLAGD